MLSLILGELRSLGRHLPVAGQRLGRVLHGKLNPDTDECTFPCGSRQEIHDPVEIIRINAYPHIKSYCREFMGLLNRIFRREIFKGRPAICAEIIDSELVFRA